MAASEPASVHIVLPAVARVPIGGYKVAYEYANALAAWGLRVTVWHSESMLAFSGDRRRLWPAVRSWLAWWLRGQRGRWRREGVPWFRFDDRVDVRATGWFPRIAAGSSDALIATAVQTTPFVAAAGRRRGSRTAVLVQHHEVWADDPQRIAEGWRAVDERIVIAPWLAEKVAEAGLDSHLLPNALVVDSFPKGLPLAERPLRVVSLLSPHAYKRPDVVMAVLEEVRRRRPDVETVTFGQSETPPITADGVAYVANPDPTVLGDLYRTARVYLCGSDEEGWHLPPAEATLSGAAVVSTDIGGVRASMEDDALYAPRADVAALAEQVIRAIDDATTSQARVDRARQRIAATTYSANAAKLTDILGLRRTPQEQFVDSRSLRGAGPVRVSVCMATYNGSAYVAEQLASILTELQPDDEVIIVDDASTDGTADLLAAIPDPRVRVFARSDNRGYVRTFEEAMRRATGDILMLADQDDVWIPGRRALFVAALQHAAVAASNLVLLGSDAPLPSPIRRVPWRLSSRRSHQRVRNELRILAGIAPYFGCAMAVRRDVVDRVLPFPPFLTESHDLWLATFGNAHGLLAHIDPPTIRRRLHAGNTSPSRPRGAAAVLRARMMLLRAWLEAVRR